MGRPDPDVERTKATLKSLRASGKYAPLSQKQLSRITGVRQSDYAQIERGSRFMNAEVATKTAPALGTDPVSLQVASNTEALRARIGRGEEGPRRALRLLNSFLDILEDSNLSPTQERLIQDSAHELMELVEREMRGTMSPEEAIGHVEDAEEASGQQRNRRHTGDDSSSYDINTYLDRDSHGKKLPQDQARRRRAEKDAGVDEEEPEPMPQPDLGQDWPEAEGYNGSDINSYLDRDSRGRRKNT